MQIRRDISGGYILRMDEFSAAFIRELPSHAATDGEKAHARIFQKPSGGKDDELDEEWAASVEPELRELFQTAVDEVVEDLAKMTTRTLKGGDVISRVKIPPKRVEAWIHVLNRARLALGAQWDVTEEDDRRHFIEGNPERSIALLRISFYGHVLGWLIEGQSEV